MKGMRVSKVVYLKKIHCVQEKLPPPFERLFLVETSSFFANLLCYLEMCKYSSCEYDINIYFFCSWNLLQETAQRSL